MDQGQVTCWHRWSLISVIAAAFLAVSLALHDNAAASDDDHGPAEKTMIELTRPELLRLVRAFVLPKPAVAPEHILRWSRWRRRHQHRAALCHRRWNEVTAAT
ncbi:hypothetical protein ACWGDX_07845 [Streptomyces sp. NPDC055025]